MPSDADIAVAALQLARGHLVRLTAGDPSLIPQADQDAIDAALSAASAVRSEGVVEPFGYWCECKGAEPVLLRKPSYIPPTDERHTTTPLYTSPVQTREDGIREAGAKLVEDRIWEKDARGKFRYGPEARTALAIAAKDVRRGRALTDAEQLENLRKALEEAPDALSQPEPKGDKT